MTNSRKHVVATLSSLCLFAGTSHADVFFSPDVGAPYSFSTFTVGNDWSSHRSDHDNDGHDNAHDDHDDNDHHTSNHMLYADQLLKINVTLDAAPQLYRIELEAKPHIKHGHDNHHDNEHNSDLFSFDIGVSVDGEFAGVITFDSVDKHWTAGFLNLGQLSGDVSITLDWLNPPTDVDDREYLKIRRLIVTPMPETPTPGTAVLMLASLGLSAPRRSRR